jgi:nitroreductase
MDINEAIRNRRSIRRYKPDAVPEKIFQEIIDTCQWAGSAMNTQPCELVIIGGEKMKKFKSQLLEKVQSGAPEGLEFPGMPEGGLPEIYTQRINEYRTTSDKYHFPEGTEDVEAKRKTHMEIASQAHNAPNMVVIYTDKRLMNWHWGLVSAGLLAQSFCLAAVDHGLGTCILGRAVAWPDLIRETCDIPKTKAIWFAIAVGYPDLDARINNFLRTRAPREEWVRYIDV